MKEVRKKFHTIYYQNLSSVKSKTNTILKLSILGDILRLPQDECTTCTCSTPPTLTCMTESCANFKIYGDTKGCEVIKAKGSCCPQKIRCPKPIVGDCPSVCTQMGFVKPQNALCQTISDECGCDRGFFCVEK